MSLSERRSTYWTIESHTETSHALTVKHLLDNRIAYWNESCRNGEAFIGAHNPRYFFILHRLQGYLPFSFLRSRNNNKSPSDMRHVLAVQHLSYNKSRCAEMSGAAFILEVYNSVDAMALEVVFQRLKLSGICVYRRNTFHVNWNQRLLSNPPYQIVLSFCVANSSHSSASLVLLYVIMALDVSRTPQYRIAKCNLIVRRSKERVISAENIYPYWNIFWMLDSETIARSQDCYEKVTYL
jgi:hypothetical protein